MESFSFRIVTYNIHQGLFKNKPTLSLIERALSNLQTDLLCFQEVWGNQDHIESQMEILSDEKWPHKAFGKNALFPKGHQGNAICSRFEIIESDNLDISVPHKENRGALFIKLKTPNQGKNLWVVNVHLGLTQNERKSQWKLILERIHHHTCQEDPIILCGDFNDWFQSLHKQNGFSGYFQECYESLTGKLPRTFPATLPLFPLDRIYIRNLSIQGCRVLSGKTWRALSDHLPLEATLEI